jgi:hypothetical protein
LTPSLGTQQGKSREIRLLRVLGTPLALGCRKDAVGIHVSMEAIHEGGSARLRCLPRVVLGVQAVCAEPGAERSLLGRHHRLKRDDLGGADSTSHALISVERGGRELWRWNLDRWSSDAMKPP